MEKEEYRIQKTGDSIDQRAEDRRQITEDSKR